VATALLVADSTPTFWIPQFVIYGYYIVLLIYTAIIAPPPHKKKKNNNNNNNNVSNATYMH